MQKYISKIKDLTIAKYLLSAGISFFIDILIFTIIVALLANEQYKIVVATIVARIISSFINYLMNKNKVFGNNKKINSTDRDSLIRYYSLVFIQMIASLVFVTLFSKIFYVWLTLIKVFVDVVIFVVNYFVQKKYIFNKKTKSKPIVLKALTFFRENKILTVALLLFVLIQAYSLHSLGALYNVKSDDLSYVHSGITFLETGKITMHGVVSAQIMPLMTFIIAFFGMFFNLEGLIDNAHFWLVLKMFWAFAALMGLIGLYKITLLLTKSQKAAIIPVILCMTADFVWMNNLILTETIFMTCFIYLIYFTLRISTQQKSVYFWLIVFFYICSVMLKGNMILYPISLICFLLLKKYDPKLLIKQVLVAFGVVAVLLSFWSFRNYKVFNKFIPLTYGGGNPLLLGTYQGRGYPADNQEEINEYLDQKMTKRAKECVYHDCHDPKMKRYYLLEKDGLVAKYRMRKWFRYDKKSFLESYLLLKPLILMNGIFYWQELFSVKTSVLIGLRSSVLTIFGLSVIYLIHKRKKVAEVLFLLLTLSLQIIVYSITFAFGRYSQTLVFIVFIIIAMFLNDIFRKRKVKQ